MGGNMWADCLDYSFVDYFIINVILYNSAPLVGLEANGSADGGL